MQVRQLDEAERKTVLAQIIRFEHEIDQSRASEQISETTPKIISNVMERI